MAWLILHRATNGTPRVAINTANILRIHDLARGACIDAIGADAEDAVPFYVEEGFDAIMAQLAAVGEEA